MSIDRDNYPIVRSPPPCAGPQLCSPNRPEFTTRDKYFVSFTGSGSSDSATADSAAILPSPFSAPEKPGAAATCTPSEPGPRILGLARREFWILVAVVAFVSLAAIVGGTVGGVLSSRRQDGTGLDPAASTTPDVPVTTDSPTQKYRTIAASTLNRTGSAGNYHIFYQDLNTSGIRYRLVWNDEVAREQNATLTIPPRQNSPLAAVTAPGAASDDIEVHIYYLSASEGGDPSIAEAVLRCDAGADNCTTASNTAIDIKHKLSTNTQLAAVLLDDGVSIRVFFQASFDYLWQTQGTTTSAGADWTSQQIGGQAAAGSSLAAMVGKASSSSSSSASTILLLFLGASSGRLRALEPPTAIAGNASSGGGGGSVVSDQLSQSVWDSTTRLAACYMPADDTYRIYYSSPAAQQQQQLAGYVRNGTAGAWEARPKLARLGTSEGNIAAVASGDEVRIVLERGGKLGVNSLRGRKWSATSFFS